MLKCRRVLLNLPHVWDTVRNGLFLGQRGFLFKLFALLIPEVLVGCTRRFNARVIPTVNYSRWYT